MRYINGFLSFGVFNQYSFIVNIDSPIKSNSCIKFQYILNTLNLVHQVNLKKWYFFNMIFVRHLTSIINGFYTNQKHFGTHSTACHYCPQWINRLTHFRASQRQRGLLKFSLGADVSPVGTTWGSRHTCFSEHALFLETALVSGGRDCHLLGLEHKRLHAGRLFWATPGDNIIGSRQHLMTRTWTNRGGLKTKIT